MVVRMMDEGDVFMLVKIKFIVYTELWCESEIHDCMCVFVATSLS